MSYNLHKLARVVSFEQKIEENQVLSFPNLALKKSQKGLKFRELLAVVEAGVQYQISR